MRSLSFLLPVLLLPIGTPGQESAIFDTTGLSAYVGSMANMGQLPSVAVAVVGPRGPIYEAHLGPGAGDDRFYLGSIPGSRTDGGLESPGGFRGLATGPGLRGASTVTPEITPACRTSPSGGSGCQAQAQPRHSSLLVFPISPNAPWLPRSGT